MLGHGSNWWTSNLIYLHKLLPALVSPIAVLVGLIALGLVSRRRWPLYAALILALITTNPLVGRWAMANLERDMPPVALEDVPQMKAVVVLGGLTRTIAGPDGTPQSTYTDGADRLFAGIDLMLLGKADTLIFTRGHLPWSVGKPEGEALAEIAVRYGVAAEKIQLTEIATNTAQEAAAVKNLLGADDAVGLITSAFHMPRALQVFEAEGLSIVPIPVDHRTGLREFSIIDLLPNADALEEVSLWWREQIGRAYYALRR